MRRSTFGLMIHAIVNRTRAICQLLTLLLALGAVHERAFGQANGQWKLEVSYSGAAGGSGSSTGAPNTVDVSVNGTGLIGAQPNVMTTVANSPPNTLTGGVTAKLTPLVHAFAQNGGASGGMSGGSIPDHTFAYVNLTLRWQPKNGDSSLDPAPPHVTVYCRRKVSCSAFGVTSDASGAAHAQCQATLADNIDTLTVPSQHVAIPGDVPSPGTATMANAQSDSDFRALDLTVGGDGTATWSYSMTWVASGSASAGSGGGGGGGAPRVKPYIPAPPPPWAKGNADITYAIDIYARGHGLPRGPFGGDQTATASDPSFTRWLPLAFSPVLSSQPFRRTAGSLPAPWGNINCAYSLALCSESTPPNLDSFGASILYNPTGGADYNTPGAPYIPIVPSVGPVPGYYLIDANGDRLVWDSGLNSPQDQIYSNLVLMGDGSYQLQNAGPPGRLRERGHYIYTFAALNYGVGRAKLLSIQDDQGNIQSLTWGNNLTVSDSSSGRQLVFNGASGYFGSVDAPGSPGTHTTLAWDGTGHLTQVKVYLSNGNTPVRTDTFTYGGPNNDSLATVTRGDGQAAYTWYADNQLTDPFGLATPRLQTATYGSSTDTTSSDGGSVAGTWSFTYGFLQQGFGHWGIDSRTNTVTDARGNTSSLLYHLKDDSVTKGAIDWVKLTGPDYTGAPANSNIVKTTYSPDIRRPTQITTVDGLNRFWFANLDGSGNLLSLLDPAADQWQFTYSADGKNLTSLTDPTNLLWQFGWTNNRVTSVTDPANAVCLTAQYNQYGQPGSLTVPAAVSASGLNETTQLGYDFVTGDLLSILLPNFDQSTVGSYDALGDPLSATVYPDTGNPQTSLSPLIAYLNWDAAQVPLSATLPNGASLNFTWNNGVLSRTQVSAPAGAGGATLLQTNYSTDTRGRVYALADLAGSLAQLRYDKNSNPTQIWDGRGDITHIAYGPNNEATSLTWPGGQSSSLLYDAGGRVRSFTDERGIVTNVTLDPDDRPQLIQFPAYPTQNLTYQWDQAGRILSINRANGDSASFSYEPARKRLQSVSTTTGGFAYTVACSWFSDGTLQSMTSPVGTTTYAWDQNGRLSSIRDPFNQTTAFLYDHIGRLLSQTSVTKLGKSIQTTLAYGLSGQGGDPSSAPAYLRRITQVSDGSVIRDYTLTHNYLGQLLSRTATGAGGFSESDGFSYDNRARLISESDSVPGHSYQGSYSWDLADNLMGGSGGWTYNSNNQLTGAPALGGLAGATGLSYDPAGDLTGANGMSFSYDALGEMTQATNTGQGTVTYSFDVLGRRASKTSGGVTTNFLYDGDSVIGENTGGSLTHSYTWGPSGLISDAKNTNGSWSDHFALNDDAGDTRATINDDGTTAEERDFSAWQQQYWASNGGSWSTPVDRGGYTDQETGLTNAGGSSFYAPAVGRFTMASSVGFTGGNPYNYASPVEDGDDFWDDAGNCTSYGSFLRKVGHEGTRQLLAMQQFQPGSKDRVQISGMLHTCPFVGQFLMAMDAVTGVDYIAGKRQTTSQRLIGGGLAIVPVVGGPLARLLRFGGGRKYLVYQSIVNADAEYVGISSNFPLRKLAHLYLYGRRVDEIAGLNGLSGYDARCVEQYLIYYWGGATNDGGTILSNVRNSIDRGDFSASQFNGFLQRGHDLLERAGYFK